MPPGARIFPSPTGVAGQAGRKRAGTHHRPAVSYGGADMARIYPPGAKVCISLSVSNL